MLTLDRIANRKRPVAGIWQKVCGMSEPMPMGLAHEMISRCFTVLAHWGDLYVDHREVKALNRDGRKAYARSTRRPPAQF